MDDARAASDEGPFLQRTWANDISAELALPYLAYTGPHDPSNPAAIEALLRAYRSEVLLRYAAWAAARAPHAAPLQPIPLRFAEQRLWLPRMVFDEEDGLPSDEPIFDDLLGRLRRWHELVLIGPAGSGKSTALWQLAHDLAHSGLAARADAELPVVVELADQPAEPDLVALLQAALRGASLTGRDGEPRPLEAHRMLAALIPQILARRPVALLWDGLDQVARGSAGQITRAIAAVTRTTGGLISLVTCRADRYPSFSAGQGGLHVAIRQAAALPLDAAATRALASGQIGADRGAQLLEQMALPTFGGQRAFAQSPLLLSMLCEVYASDGSLPESQGALLARWAARRLAAARERTSPAVTAEVGLRGIAQLAIAITSSYGRGAAAPLGWALDQIRSAAPGADPDEIAGLARQAGLVVRSGDAPR